MCQRESILAATKEMFEYNEQALTRLEAVQLNKDYEVDFFGEVKPYADVFFKKLDGWAQITEEWVQNEHPKYIHANQVDSTKENLQNVVLQSFYQDTRPKRFKQMYQANKYVLDSILTYYVAEK